MLRKLASSLQRLRTGGEGESFTTSPLTQLGINRRAEGEPTGDSQDRSRLFACTSCGTVYIDVKKQLCSECDAPVEQIPSTLAEIEEL